MKRTELILLKMKAELEELKKIIPEIVELNVYINNISTSTHDVLLESVFKNEDDLLTYKNHPTHQKVGKFIGSVTQNRCAFDYFVNLESN